MCNAALPCAATTFVARGTPASVLRPDIVCGGYFETTEQGRESDESENHIDVRGRRHDHPGVRRGCRACTKAAEVDEAHSNHEGSGRRSCARHSYSHRHVDGHEHAVP